MRNLTIDYIKENLLNAHYQINDDSGNWYGVTPHQGRYIVIRNGVKFCRCRTLDRVIKVLREEGC